MLCSESNSQQTLAGEGEGEETNQKKWNRRKREGEKEVQEPWEMTRRMWMAKSDSFESKFLKRSLRGRRCNEEEEEEEGQ